MPKPTQTMLDRLAETFKSMGKKKPEIIQQTTIRDPLGYSIVQRRFGTATGKMPSMKPERQAYQEGLESLRGQKMKPIQEEKIDARERFKELQDDFEDAYSDAYESWQDEINSNVPDQAPILEYGFSPDDLYFRAPEADLRDYWPPYAKYYDVFEREADDLRDEIAAIDDRMDYTRSPEYIQQLQTQTPRYRNYQRAMMQRAENARVGRLNAKIMHLARMGYSLPEIRAMLNGTMPTPAVGGR